MRPEAHEEMVWYRQDRRAERFPRSDLGASAASPPMATVSSIRTEDVVMLTQHHEQADQASAGYRAAALDEVVMLESRMVAKPRFRRWRSAPRPADFFADALVDQDVPADRRHDAGQVSVAW